MGKMKFHIRVPSACRLPIVLMFVGVLLMMVSHFFTAPRKYDTCSDLPQSSVSQPQQNYTDGATQSIVTDWRTITSYHQNRLQNFLKNIQGVGDVSVMVYCDRSSILELISNSVLHTQTTEESDGNGGNRVVQEEESEGQYLVLEDQYGNQRVVAVQESVPAITAVCVVCEGGGKMAVQERVIAAIATLYDLPPSKIAVLPGK